MKNRRLLAIVIFLVLIALITFLIQTCREKRFIKISDHTPSNLPRVHFILEEKGITIRRDYNQLHMIPIRNDGPGIARLRIASNHFPDFPAGFVGRGTPDWETPDTVLEIAPGEIWEAPLMLHANHPQQASYQLNLTATHLGTTVGSGTLQIQIDQPKLELTTSWSEPQQEIDRARLVRHLHIRNNGANVPDLSLHFKPTGNAPAQPIHLEPALEKNSLTNGDIIQVRVAPYIHPTFVSLEGTLVISGLGQEISIPYLAAVPEGQAVFVTLARTTSRHSNDGRRCTNSPRATYNLPATNGTPSDSPFISDGGGFTVPTITPAKPTQPDTSPTPPVEPTKPEETASWSLFGPITGEAAATEPEKKPTTAESDKKDDAPEEAKNDEGSFELMDANAEGLIGGTIEQPMRDDSTKPVNPINTNAMPPKNATTFIDSDGKRTHMVRRPHKDGTEFVNFGFGMQGEGKRFGGKKIRSSGVAPRIGPNPRPDSPGLLHFAEKSDDGKNVIKSFDPATGNTTVLSDPAHDADSPLSLRTPAGVKTLFREDGEIRNLNLDENLTTKPDTAWPAGEKTGPLLASVAHSDGKLALLTDEGDGTIAYRDGANTKPYKARAASLAANADSARLALLDENGSISVVDPTTGTVAHKVAGEGYTAPSLAVTKEGDYRLFFHKPLPAAAPHNPDATGTALGGNFSIDSNKDGTWKEPRRVFLPESPVTDAVVAVEITAPLANAHYKKMDTDVSFNGRKLQSIESQVPFGRYLYHVPAHTLKYRSTAGTQSNQNNQVVIDAKGIGPGNFHITDKCAVYGKHDWTQACFVAPTSTDADRIAQSSSPEMRHNAPDIILATNGASLPKNLRPGQETSLTISAFNSGDLPSTAGEVTVTHEGKPIGKGQLPAMPAFRGAPLKVDFTVPAQWKRETSLQLNVQAPDAGDADPSTNTLELPLHKELINEIAGPSAPARIDLSTLPKDSIVDVPSDKPFSATLQKDRLWFRIPVKDSRNLQFEVNGPGADQVRDLNLFDATGQAVSQQAGRWNLTTDTIYARIGYPPSTDIPADTQLKIWWE